MIYPSSEGVPLNGLPAAPIGYRSSSLQKKSEVLKSGWWGMAVPNSVRLQLFGQAFIRLCNENPRKGNGAVRH